MKLCEHLQPIYEKEMRKGNCVADVLFPNTKLCRFAAWMRLELPEDPSWNAVRHQNCPWDPEEIGYFCHDCRCGFFYWFCGTSELDEVLRIPNPLILVTPSNVYVQEGATDSIESDMMQPAHVTDEQRQEIEDHWAAHPEERAALVSELKMSLEKRWKEYGNSIEYWYEIGEKKRKRGELAAIRRAEELSRKLLLGYGWDTFQYPKSVKLYK